MSRLLADADELPGGIAGWCSGAALITGPSITVGASIHRQPGCCDDMYMGGLAGRVTGSGAPPTAVAPIATPGSAAIKDSHRLEEPPEFSILATSCLAPVVPPAQRRTATASPTSC
jgi:hypothetical protein